MNHPLRPRHGLTGEDIVVEFDGGPAVDGPPEHAVRGHVGPQEPGVDSRLDDVVGGGAQEKRARRPGGRTQESGREAVPSRDPVRAYLRDMGAGQPLSREEEVALAMRIEAARDTVVARLCAVPAVVGRVAAWMDGIREGRLRAADVFELSGAAAEGPDAVDEPVDARVTPEAARPPAAAAEGDGQARLADAVPNSDLAPVLDHLAEAAAEIATLVLDRAGGGDGEVLVRLKDCLSRFPEGARIPLRADRVSALMEMVNEESGNLRAAETELARLATERGVERRSVLDMLAGPGAGGRPPPQGGDEAMAALRERFDAVERRTGLPHGEFRRAAAEAGKAWRQLKAERERMVRSQLPLVVSIARRYQHRTSLELLDLVQEGNLGLMHAVEKFDHRRGVKVATYAVWWIRQSIARAIADKGRMIRVPVHMAETAGKVMRERRTLLQREGRQAEAEEIARRTGLPLEHVRRALTLVQEPTSLDVPVGEDGDATLGDLIEARDAVDPHEAAEASALRDQIREALGELSPREQRILQMRFGIGDSSEHTLEEVGREFGVTRERIRQIEAKALGRLRQARQSRALMSFIEP